ncbi:MAG: dephospho-CoA kinase [Deltaproteobacteria bacterium]|nr:dephospho-CoA kinase [Deltaproteobacteria bacterium]
MRRIGLTGGIATGKSTVLETLAACGAAVLDADAIVHELYANSAVLRERVRALFGDGCLRADGQLDREAVARRVFADAAARAQLEGLIHPLVWATINERAAALAARKPPLLVFDIPLLFEVCDLTLFDAIVVVSCDRATQVRRIMKRYQCDQPTAEARIDSQLPLHEKLARADYVIETNGLISDTRTAVRNLYRHLLR